jgi:hypothetical protein
VVAFDCGYLTQAETEGLGKECLEIGAMLGAMMNRAEEFCGESSTLREDPPEDTVFLLD